MAKKAKSKQPKKKPIKKRSRKIASKSSPKRAPAKKALVSPSKRAAPRVQRTRQEIIERALIECMDTLTTHGNFDWDEGPGTWEMSKGAWEEVLTCVCTKSNIKFSAPLLKKTIARNFSEIADILLVEPKV